MFRAAVSVLIAQRSVRGFVSVLLFSARAGSLCLQGLAIKQSLDREAIAVGVSRRGLR